MIRKIRLIATRDFVTTVTNKGFLIGLLILPAMMAAAMTLAPRILNSKSPQVRGEVAVIDPTGKLATELKAALDPDAIAGRRGDAVRRALAQTAPGSGNAVAPVPTQTALNPIPLLTILERPPDAALSGEKEWLAAQSTENEPRLALIVFHPDAVTRAAGQSDFGTYDFYVSPGMDPATEGVIYEGLRQALIAARFKGGNLDRAEIEATMRVARSGSIILAAGGEQKSSRGFNVALPFALGLLIFIGVMAGGQTLLTSTIEEKSSRVVEVLLAAVSPLELMWGKLLGQLAVGLLMMGVYVGLGLLGLVQLGLLGLLDPVLLVYLFLFFLITYLVFGALMMAVGAAVNQVADAQSLMGPIMVLLLAPYMLAPVIGAAPNSTFSVLASFVPPVNTFAMMARMASGTPPPMWQPLLTLLIGFGTAALAVWFAAKIFKIGLLMHGKPPNFATLLRWARMA